MISPLAAAALAVVARLQPLRSADVLWQIRSGEEVLRRHARVPVDLYYHAFRGRPIHDHEAAFEALVAAIHNVGGLRALWWAAMVLAVVVGTLATHSARKLVPSSPARVIAAAAVVALIAARSELRAELATFAAIGVAHALRRRARDDAPAIGLRLAPIAVAAVAAPFHGLAWWVAVVPLAHAAAGVFERPRAWRRIASDVAVAVGCAAMVATISRGVVALNVQSLGGSAIIEHINELRTPLSLLVTGSNVMPFAAQLACVAALFGLWRLNRRGAASCSDVVLFAMLIVPSLRYARFATMPLLAAMPWAIAGMAALVDIEFSPRLRALRVGAPAIAAALSVVVITAEYGWDRRTIGFDESTLPADSVAYLRASRPNAALFHPYNFGPYLIYTRYPPRGVVIDPRAQMVYPNDYVRRYYEATRDPVVFERWADEAPFDTVLLSRQHKGTRPLREYLARSPRWREVHEDAVSVVFVRK